MPPPGGPWPETGTFLLHLCQDDSAEVWEWCAGGGAVTDEEKWVIERTLASLPEVTSYGRKSPEGMLAIARQDYRVGDILTADVMHEGYGGTLGQGDWRALLRTLGDLPGVGAPIAYRDDFWWGKADVSVIEKVYAEDPAHAAKARGHIAWLRPFGDGPLDDLPESFYVKIADPGTAARIEKAVAGMSGVARVREVAPVAAP
ncbi:hypothetical protein [Microtetraspora malaysiensis]|uniref:hypothetical protein n=1 Tax=Microtetraspora malaysiensis TaxID=161358 RepID=UPI00082D7333|nr:hypothetical protein [Microtetraspora malaysiensis]